MIILPLYVLQEILKGPYCEGTIKDTHAQNEMQHKQLGCLNGVTLAKQLCLAYA